MADRSQPIATETLRSWGLWTFKASDSIQIASRFGGGKSTLIKPKQPGRADVIAGWNGQLIFVEVKDGNKSFAFNRWEAHQRQWAYAVEHVCKLPYWIFLVIGVHNPNWNPEKYTPKLAFLLPRLTLLAVERILKPYQASLPYFAGKGYGKELQGRGLDAIHLLDKYKLPWGKGNYVLPKNHKFNLAYQPPLIDLRDSWNQIKNQESNSHESIKSDCAS